MRRSQRRNRWIAAALLWLSTAGGVALVSAASAPAEPFTRALDAYFDEQPYRAIVLLHESMARSDTVPLREASLYVLGQCFASIHLYEKAEDSLSALLNEFPNGAFAPIALRELGRIFFDLHEYAAVVNLEQTYSGQLAAPSGIPAEFWYLAGESNYLLGRKPQARDLLMRTQPGTSFFPFARYTLAQVEFGLGRPAEALDALAEVGAYPGVATLLRDRAARASGMILYDQKRYTEAMQVYRKIAESSTLYGQSRVDLALAADAAGDSNAARDAFATAMDSASDDLLRTEARVAVGRFLTRRENPGAARTLFEQALADLKAREGKLNSAVASDSDFRPTFDELVTFARQSSGVPRGERRAEDLELLRSTLASTMGVGYRHAKSPAPEKLAPKSYLFPLLQRHFHDPAIIETFVDLTVEVQDLKKQIVALAGEIRDQKSKWNADPPVQTGAAPQELRDALSQMVWLQFANYDLVTRFYDALAIHEKIDQAAVVREKQRALAKTIEGLRLILYGDFRVPPEQELLAVMDAAREKIAAGKLPGMAAQSVRDGFLQEWKSDRDSLTYVAENLGLKERQMNSALTGVPLRARNVNLPVLSTMTDWLTALQQLVSKYRYIDVAHDQRTWFLAGKNEAAVSVLTRAEADLDGLEGQSQRVLREAARELIGKEQLRHSLIVAQAEEGIADALFHERAQR